MGFQSHSKLISYDIKNDPRLGNPRKTDVVSLGFPRRGPSEMGFRLPTARAEEIPGNRIRFLGISYARVVFDII